MTFVLKSDAKLGSFFELTKFLRNFFAKNFLPFAKSANYRGVHAAGLGGGDGGGASAAHGDKAAGARRGILQVGGAEVGVDAGDGFGGGVDEVGGVEGVVAEFVDEGFVGGEVVGAAEGIDGEQEGGFG